MEEASRVKEVGGGEGVEEVVEEVVGEVERVIGEAV